MPHNFMALYTFFNRHDQSQTLGIKVIVVITDRGSKIKLGININFLYRLFHYLFVWLVFNVTEVFL